MPFASKTLVAMALAASLIASCAAQAGPRRHDLVAGALAGAAVGALAGSAFAFGPPASIYVDRAPPVWHRYPAPPSRFDVEHDWDDHDDDWDD